MKLISTEEIMNYIFIEACIEKLRKDNVTTASKMEKLNKLTKIKDEFIDKNIEILLNETK